MIRSITAALANRDEFQPAERRALRWIALATMLGSCAAALTGTAAEHEQNPPVAAAADPVLVVGNAACVKCHASEQAVWSATPHARTFDELHRRPEAAQIAAKLGVASVKHGDRCVACHYTQQVAGDPNAVTTVSRSSTPANANFHSIAGVACESCHGAAKNWLEVHHDYGSPSATRLTESAAHRRDRITRSVALGMRNPHNVYLVAQSCYRCHTTGNETLVNVGGHSAGSLDFEFVSWSQGTVHHNFVNSDGKQNQASSPERLRFMFLAGVIADTEASLRALATATVKETYAMTVAKRAARAGSRLRSVAEKIDDPRLAQAVAVFDAVAIKLNNGPQLESGANELAMIGWELADAETNEAGAALRAKLPALDPFIPARQTWK